MTRYLPCAALLVLTLQGCKAPESAASAAAPAGKAAAAPAPAPAATTAPAAAAANVTTPADVAAPAATPAPAPVAPRPTLSEGVCAKNKEAFTDFFEAVVDEPKFRAAHSAPIVVEVDLQNPSKTVSRPGEPFRITAVDYQWSYDEPGKDRGQLSRIKMKFKQVGDRMRVDFVRAEFSPEEDVVRTFGAPAAYVFDHWQGCWRLIQHLR